MKNIKVFAPATVANVSCGFDIFGLAVENPGDEAILTLRNDDKIVIKAIHGDHGKLSLDPAKNAVTVPIIKYLESIDSKQGFDVELFKKMPLGSGLGSSSASSVVGVFAANALLDSPLANAELLSFAMEGERIACGSAHADNVAPALLGGFVVIRSYSPLDFFKISVPDDLFVSIVHPDIEVNTKDARVILRNEVSLKNVIQQMGNVAGLVAGLQMSDYGLISRSMEDKIIEPVRSILIPHFFEVKEASKAAGSLGSSISGAGPSIFSFSKGEETAQKVAERKAEIFTKVGIKTNTYVSAINKNGPKIL